METKMQKVSSFAADAVTNLEMRIAAATVKTIETTDKEIRVEARNLQDGIYTCEVRAGKLVISYKIKGIGHFCKLGQDETQIILYLPSNFALEYATLEIGAGELCMDTVPISCRGIDVEIGAGKWKAAQISVLDRLNVTIGAGKAIMKKITAGSVDIECGVGSSAYKGRINGDIRVNCGVGNCSFQLKNKESDFNYEVSCALGSVLINKNRIKSFASRKFCKNETAPGTAVLICGLGNIEFETEK